MKKWKVQTRDMRSMYGAIILDTKEQAEQYRDNVSKQGHSIIVFQEIDVAEDEAQEIETTRGMNAVEWLNYRLHGVIPSAEDKPPALIVSPLSDRLPSKRGKKKSENSSD